MKKNRSNSEHRPAGNKGFSPKMRGAKQEPKNKLRNQNDRNKANRNKDNNKNLPTGKFLTGIIRISKSGNGFIDFNENESVIIPKGELSSAISGDTVRIELLPKRRDKPGDAGTVVEIIKRGTTHIAGTIDCEGTTFYLKPMKSKFPFLVYITPGHLNGATCGSAAFVKITNWVSDIPGNVVGEVTKVFGTRGEHETDMAMILAESLQDAEFTKDLLDEVRKFKDVNATDELKNGRRDFRGITTFTIDPERAQDFDDALSIEENKDGTYTIGIHIADVSNYIKENSNLDLESFRRGTSIYLVDRCIPMLPERLSNDLCSLREGVPRLTMSTVVKIQKDGNILEHWVGTGIIESNKRFTYGDVDEILENKAGLYYKELDILMNLAEILEKGRVARGALVFNRDEIRFILDPTGKPIDIVREHSSPSHLLIESFMLLANNITAQMIEDYGNGEGKKHGMYRVHGKPNETAIFDLVIFAKQCGIRTPQTLEKPLDIIKHIMKKSVGNDMESILNDMIIRAQAKAHYSEVNSGHFGLALLSYNHFTSPIRRYPDLVVHRLIKNIMAGKELYYSKAELHGIADHSSEREEKATEAERASIRYKQIEFLENSIGTVRMGRLVGMTDTVIKIIDDETMAMVHCSQSKYRFTLGQKVEYTLDKADRLQDELSGIVNKPIEVVEK